MFKSGFIFKHPTTVQVSGPTQAGKTEFVIKLLQNKNTLFSPPPDRIIWAYGHANEKQINRISQIDPDIEFVEGLPQLDDINPAKNNLIIFDDLMTEIGNNTKVVNLFTRGSHHDNITIISIIHNLFNQQKYSKTIGLNSRVIICFKSPRDNQQMDYFGRQIFPRNKHFLSSALDQANYKPYGYIIIDLQPQTPDSLRVRSGIFPGELPIIYVPTN
jgi:hypothetical protein